MIDGYPMIQGLVHAGEYVFVRAGDELDDRDLFELLGLEIGPELSLDHHPGRYMAYVARSPLWVHFCDNVSYKFSHLPDHDSRIERAAAL